MVITQEHREAAKQQSIAERQRRKKSAAAILRLRAAAEREKANKVANSKLINLLMERIALCPENAVEVIMDFMYRVSKRNTNDIHKRAIKAAHFLSRGCKLETIHDLMAYGELLPEDSSGHLMPIISGSRTGTL
jgi:hypothetical protein